MANWQVHLEAILGKKVCDDSGKLVGHIEEVLAIRQGNDWIVKEYHVGVIAMLERLAAMTFLDPIVRLLNRERRPPGHIIPWDKLDLGDPEHPRLLGAKSDLKPLEDSD